MRQLLSTIIVLLIIYSCEPYVAFTESQPVDKKALSKFPSKIRGTYKDFFIAPAMEDGTAGAVIGYEFKF